MADKEIVNLPAVPAFRDDAQLVVYVPGSSEPAQKMTGAQLREYAERAAANVKKGDKGDPGDVSSVNGVRPDAAGNVTINGVDIGVIPNASYKVHHDGTKPTGTYTGNGEARTIETGGIGSVAFIWSTSGYGALVHYYGAIAFRTNGSGGNDIVTFNYSEGIHFRNGVLSIAGNHAALNRTSIQTTYVYQVL